MFERTKCLGSFFIRKLFDRMGTVGEDSKRMNSLNENRNFFEYDKKKSDLIIILHRVIPKNEFFLLFFPIQFQELLSQQSS